MINTYTKQLKLSRSSKTDVIRAAANNWLSQVARGKTKQTMTTVIELSVKHSAISTSSAQVHQRRF